MCCAKQAFNAFTLAMIKTVTAIDQGAADDGIIFQLTLPNMTCDKWDLLETFPSVKRIEHLVVHEQMSSKSKSKTGKIVTSVSISNYHLDSDEFQKLALDLVVDIALNVNPL